MQGGALRDPVQVPLYTAAMFSSAIADREAAAQPTDVLLYHLSAEQEHTLLHGPRAITIHYIRQSGDVVHKQNSCSGHACVYYRIFALDRHLYFSDMKNANRSCAEKSPVEHEQICLPLILTST